MTKEKIKEAIYTRRYIYNFHYHLIWVTKYRNHTGIVYCDKSAKCRF